MSWFLHARPQASTNDLWHGKGDIRATTLGTVVNNVDAGALFGRSWSLGAAALTSGYLIWPGGDNLPTNIARTYHIRFRTKYSGNAPGSACGIFGLTGLVQVANVHWLNVGVLHSTDGTLRVYLGTNQNGLAGLINISLGVWSPVAGTVYDMQLVWDGTTATNAVKLFINGVLFGQTSSARAIVGSIDPKLHAFVQIGQAINSTATGIDVEEFAVSSTALTDLSAFTGGSRTTDIIGLSQFSGLTWPLVGKVKDGETWNKYGVPETGTREDANPNKVIVGESFGEGGTELQGTYVEVTPDKVLDETFYGANGTEFEGTLVLGCDYPVEADVRDGVIYNFGANTGSFGRHIPQTNQYWAPLEVQTEIYAILNADSALTALIGANRVFDFVPDKQPFPYITLNILPFIDRDNATNDGLQCEFQVNVWYAPGKTGQTSRGNKPVQLIQKRIDELLQKRSVCVNGWNTLQLRRTYIDIETEADNVTKHGIQRFILFLGSKD